jgi:hypothetical protein
MIYLDTTKNISNSSLIDVLQHRIQGTVRIRRDGSIYFFHCQKTPEFYQVILFIQQHGGFPLFIEGDVVVLKHTIPSKL